MQTNDRTDRYFKDRLAGYEQSPPDSNWEMIAQKMSKRRKKVMGLLFFRIAAGMALLASIGVGYYFVNQSDRPLSHSGIVADAVNQIPENTYVENPDIPVSSEPKNINNPISQSETKRPSETSVTHINGFHNLQSGAFESPIPSVETQAIFEEPVAVTMNYFEMTRIPSLGNSVILQNLPGLVISGNRADPLSQDEAVALLLADYNESFDEVAEKKEMHRWELGGEIAPLYSDRSISSGSLESSVINNLNQNESGIMAYAGGIRIAFSPAKRISVQSGVYYSRYGQTKNEAMMMFNNLATSLESSDMLLVTNSTGKISVKGSDGNVSMISNSLPEGGRNDFMTQTFYNNTATEEVTIKQTFDYFEVPLVLKYKIIDRKIDFSFSGGVITNFLVGNKVNMIEGGESTIVGETTQIKEVNYVGSIGLGLDYPLVPRFSLTLEPRFRYYINAIDQSSQLTVHPYSFGFFAGVNYRF